MAIKTIKAVNASGRDAGRFEVVIIGVFGQAEVLLPEGLVPRKRAGLWASWHTTGTVCGPKDRPMQWWSNK